MKKSKIVIVVAGQILLYLIILIIANVPEMLYASLVTHIITQDELYSSDEKNEYGFYISCDTYTEDLFCSLPLYICRLAYMI